MVCCFGARSRRGKGLNLRREMSGWKRHCPWVLGSLRYVSEHFSCCTNLVVVNKCCCFAISPRLYSSHTLHLSKSKEGSSDYGIDSQGSPQSRTCWQDLETINEISLGKLFSACLISTTTDTWFFAIHHWTMAR